MLMNKYKKNFCLIASLVACNLLNITIAENEYLNSASNEANVINYSLSNLDTLVEVAAEEGYIKAEDKERLIKFRNNPSDESWMK